MRALALNMNLFTAGLIALNRTSPAAQVTDGG